MATYRRCPTCQELYSGKKCRKCELRYSKKAQEKNEARKLYSSRTWLKCRQRVRARYLDYDIWLMAEGIVYKCPYVMVHHILERDERPDLVYDLDNLITVSPESHSEIHKLYEIDKPAAIRRIGKGIARFEEVFADA